MMPLLLLLALLPSLLLARPSNFEAESESPFIPWLTGPLLANPAEGAEPDHPALDITFSFRDTYGNYNSDWKVESQDALWTMSLFIDYQFGLTERVGMEIIASASARFQNGERSIDLNDTILLLGFQILEDTKGTWIPDFRILLQTIYPTGPYDNLDSPRKRDAFLSGQGAFFIGPSFDFQKLFYLQNQFFMLHWGVSYSFPTKATIEEFSIYGGGLGTDGTILPGQLLNAYISGEYTLTRHWALAMDLFLIYQRGTSNFKGDPGRTLTGEIASIGLPPSTQLSITPSIEYNQSKNLGYLFGAWLTIAGRNSPAYAGGFVSLVYVF